MKTAITKLLQLIGTYIVKNRLFIVECHLDGLSFKFLDQFHSICVLFILLSSILAQ